MLDGLVRPAIVKYILDLATITNWDQTAEQPTKLVEVPKVTGSEPSKIIEKTLFEAGMI